MGATEGGCKTQWKQWLAALGMTVTMVTVGYLEILVKVDLERLRLNDDIPVQLKEWAIVFTIFGCLIGAIFGGYSADMFGRKKALLTTAVCAIGGSISKSLIIPAGICLNLLFAGINAGITCTVLPLYVSEIADKKIRGNLLMLQLLGIYTGQFMVISFNPYVPPFLMMDALSIAISILLIIFFDCFPETPYHLASKKQYEAAAKSLAFFKGMDEFAAREELEEIINAVEENSNRRGISQKITDLFRGKSLKGLMMIVLLIIVQWDTTCINVRDDLAYSLQNVLSIKLHCALIIMSATYVIWSVILVLTIDAVGRRLYLLGATAGGLAITCFAMVVIMDRSYIYFFTDFILYLCQIVIFGVHFVWVGELFPSHVKSIACAMVVIFATIFKGSLSWTTYLEPEYKYWLPGLLIPLYLLAFIFILTSVPETKKKTFLDIQKGSPEQNNICISIDDK